MSSDRQREAKGIVVEGADRLGDEKRPEPLGPEQGELALLQDYRGVP